MAAHITVADAQSWLESTRTNLGATVDPGLEGSISAQVLARVSNSYDTSTWVDANSTPALVRTVIGMKYASWYYQRQYSEDGTGTNEYALLLNAQAEVLLAGIVEGTFDLPEVQGLGGNVPYEGPAFYPNDAASQQPDPTVAYEGGLAFDQNFQGARFSMGKIW